MPIPCTAKFTATEADSVRALASKVYMVLGDYCTAAGTSASSSGDFSADYPAAGAINGDRTEINVGPAATADNNIGKASWRSNLIPDSGANVYLIVDFGVARTINRLKVYMMVGHGMTFYVEYWDGAAWQSIPTDDQAGFGNNPFGDTPFGDPGTWGLSNDFLYDITTTKIKITITATDVVNDYANIVEVEAYRLIDISSRVNSWAINKSRDFKLRQDMASTSILNCDNTDKFFSPSYTPTAAEIAAGYINSELRSQLGIEIYAGFEWSGSQVELLPQFTGSIDRLQANSKSRGAAIECRDPMKNLFSNINSSLLKTGISIQDAILYVLNLRNVSVWDTDLDDSKLTISYFFGSGASAKSIIDELVVASGDAQFYYDETGKAVYKQYSASIPNNTIYYQKTSTVSNQPGWDEYTSIDNISLDRQANQVTISWVKLSGWVDGDFTSNPVWTPIGPSKLSIAAQKLTVSTDGAGWAYSEPFIYIPLAANLGQWQAYVHYQNPDASSVVYVSMRLIDGTPVFAADTGVPPQSTITTSGYEIRMSGVGSCAVSLIRWDSGVPTVLATSATIGGSSPNILDWLKVIRKDDGTFKIYWGGVLLITHLDATYTTFTNFALGMEKSGNGDCEIWGSAAKEVYYTQEYVDTATADDHNANTPTWISDTIDLGADIVSLGNLEATILAQTNCTPTLYTRTSADGLAWDAWVQVNPNAAMGSVARRYLQVKMAYSAMTYSLGVLPTPSLISMTINWTRSGGTSKYPATSSRTISFDGSLLDVTDVSTSTLGGDNSILNDIYVVGQPYNLTGEDTDVVWEYLTGIPAATVSAANPLFVNVGTVDINASIPAGMDTSRMAGTNPACLHVVYGTAAGSAEIINKSPTGPVIRLTIGTAGTITSLQLLGKAFSTSVRNFAYEAKDSASILLNGIKSENINNAWILNNGIAQKIAEQRLANYKDETRILDNVNITLQPSTRIGDRVTAVDSNTGISADYWVVGINHSYSVSQIYTIYTLWKIPGGM